METTQFWYSEYYYTPKTVQHQHNSNLCPRFLLFRPHFTFQSGPTTFKIWVPNVEPKTRMVLDVRVGVWYGHTTTFRVLLSQYAKR